MPFYPFLGEGSPAKIDCRKKGSLILTSLLEDLVKIGAKAKFFRFWRSQVGSACRSGGAVFGHQLAAGEAPWKHLGLLGSSQSGSFIFLVVSSWFCGWVAEFNPQVLNF